MPDCTRRGVLVGVESGRLTAAAAKGVQTHMPTCTLLRLAGLPLLVGGIIGAIVVAIHPNEITDPIDGPVHIALFFGVLLVLLGWPAVLARQASRIGILGPIGFVLVFVGLAVGEITHSVLEFSVVPLLAADPATRPLLAPDSAISTALMHSPFGLMLLLEKPVIALGLVMFAVATLRARTSPRWPAAVQLVAAVTVVLMMVYPPLGPVGGALFYLGMAAYGAVLLSPIAAFEAVRTGTMAPRAARG